jgi:Icc protein
MDQYSMCKEKISVLHLTDLHLFANSNRHFNNIFTRNSFEKVIQHVLMHFNLPDLIIITGDMAQDGKPATYHYIRKILAEFNVPVYFVFGNHDNPKNATPVFSSAPVSEKKYIQTAKWQFVLLDSNHNNKKNSYMGEVSKNELERLKYYLDQYPDKSTLIAMHHNLPNYPLRGVNYEIRNHRQISAFFRKYPQIKIVISGHVHQEFVIFKQGICYLSTPATGYQSKSKRGKITEDAAGYRWIYLYKNGDFTTDVYRIDKSPS